MKRGELRESEYFAFLESLGNLNGIVCAVATDMSTNEREMMVQHRYEQAQRVLAPIDKMVHQSMRDAITRLSADLAALPVNLYAQLKFQTILFHTVMAQATLYYSQRIPQTLREFRWRVDRKDVVLTGYEKTFQQLLPALLQSISLREPLIMLRGADYTHMTDFEWVEGEAPDYLSKDYGLPEVEGLNLGKMIKNFQFVDSKAMLGVQVGDLVASGIRCFLKGEFADNKKAARLLGRLTVDAARPSLPIRLLTLGDESKVETEATQRVQELERHSRPMLT